MKISEEPSQSVKPDPNLPIDQQTGLPTPQQHRQQKQDKLSVRIPANNHILLCTPVHEGMTNNHARSLTDIFKTHLKLGQHFIVSPYYVLGCPNITIARNSCISHFYNNINTFTHLLFLDDDVFLSGDSILKLLSHHVDFIGAPVPLKEPNPVTKQKQYNIGKISEINQNTGLAKVAHVGTAAMLISRNAVRKYIETLNIDDMYYGEHHPGLVDRGNPQYNCFKIKTRDQRIMSSDVNFCFRMHDIGFDVYCDLTIYTEHQGMVNVKGDNILKKMIEVESKKGTRIVTQNSKTKPEPEHKPLQPHEVVQPQQQQDSNATQDCVQESEPLQDIRE